jgi:thioredoxin reductase (NADPH)
MPGAVAPVPTSPPRPLIVALDDDPAVLGAVARDLRRAYGERYRILRAASGAEALTALRGARLRDEQVALFLVDQRMPRMSGLEFLTEAIALFPTAKRVLLTAYADTEASIRAINESLLDSYLLKPWDPPEERLYPVLDDLLDDWQASFRPPFVGLRIVGRRGSAASHQVKEFLVRNLVPYRWLDVERDAEAEGLLALTGRAPTTSRWSSSPTAPPWSGPRHWRSPSASACRRAPRAPFYDLVIVGAGPAGLAAAVYGASEGLRTLVVESDAPGGQAGTSASHRELPRVPRRAVGWRPGAARRHPGPPLRRGDPDAAHGDRHPGRGPVPLRVSSPTAARWLPRRAHRHRGGVPHARRPGAERLSGAGLYYGSVLTEVADARGAERVRRRRRQLGRPGGDVPRQARGRGDDAGARAVALRQHVAVPDRPDRGERTHHGATAGGRGGTARGDDPRGAHAPRARRRHLCPVGGARPCSRSSAPGRGRSGSPTPSSAIRRASS